MIRSLLHMSLDVKYNDICTPSVELGQKWFLKKSFKNNKCNKHKYLTTQHLKNKQIMTCEGWNTFLEQCF